MHSSNAVPVIWIWHSKQLEDTHVPCAGGVAVIRPGFGEGNGPILMTEVGCSGSESRLEDCPSSTSTESCEHSDDVGVVCRTGLSRSILVFEFRGMVV